MVETVEPVIYIQWEGPLTPAQVKLKNKPNDFGLYQVYAHHPVYGRGVLVYIGQTRDTFAGRILQHRWEKSLSEPDPERVEFYVGRLKGAATPDLGRWHKEIDLAEKLLIYALAPAYNSTYIKDLIEKDPEVCTTRVINSGAARSLQREISGRVWTDGGVKQFEANLKIYEMP